MSHVPRSSRVLRRALRLAVLVVAGLVVVVVALKLTDELFPDWRASFQRYPSARPVANGFSVSLDRLCAHPKAAARPWRYIVVHHSATAGGSAASFERYQTGAGGWDSLAYHFVIGNGTQTGDGVIEVGPRWSLQREGAHAGVPEYNERGIGICLVGDFTAQGPTPLQMRSLHALVRYLMRSYSIPLDGVLGHQECPGAATECPGLNFPMDQFRQSLSEPAH